MQFPKSPKNSANISGSETCQSFWLRLRFSMLNNGCILAQLRERSNRGNLKSKFALLLWAIVLGLFVGWRAQNLDAFGLTNDEGAYLMWTRLALDGYPLYAETRAVQPPLFFEWLGLAFRLAGSTLEVGRWAILLSFGLLAAGVSGLAHRFGGWLAALVALLLLGSAPIIFTLSRLVMAEIPATSLAVLSIALVFHYLDSDRKAWLLASGLALGLSLMIKLLNPFIAVPVGLLLLWRARRPAGDMGGRPSLLKEAGWWGSGVLIPFLLVCLFYDPTAMYEQLIAFRGDLRAAIPGSWTETWGQFGLLLRSHWGYVLLALGGIVAASWRFHKAQQHLEKKKGATGQENKFSFARVPDSPTIFVLTWGVWLISGTVMLAWHTPLFYQHLVILLPPLILLGTGFAVETVNLWQACARRMPTLVYTELLRQGIHLCRPAVVSSLIIVIAMLNLPAIVEANQQAAAIVTGGREAEAIKLLKAVSSPYDFLMTDSQLLIFLAGRRTPPPLGDVALVAVKAGWQTSARMIALTQEFRAPAVAQWSLRLPWLPEYIEWVEANYLARRVWDNDHIIYFAPRFPAGQPLPHERMERLGEAVTLRGYELDDGSLRLGHNLSFKVYWQTDKPLVKDYTVFNQLLDSDGTLVTGWDSQPLGGYLPTSQWPVDEIVTDVVRLPLPSNLPAGDYALVTGLYRLDTLERLLTADGIDHISLTIITLPE